MQTLSSQDNDVIRPSVPLEDSGLLLTSDQHTQWSSYIIRCFEDNSFWGIPHYIKRFNLHPDEVYKLLIDEKKMAPCYVPGGKGIWLKVSNYHLGQCFLDLLCRALNCEESVYQLSKGFFPQEYFGQEIMFDTMIKSRWDKFPQYHSHSAFRLNLLGSSFQKMFNPSQKDLERNSDSQVTIPIPLGHKLIVILSDFSFSDEEQLKEFLSVSWCEYQVNDETNFVNLVQQILDPRRLKYTIPEDVSHNPSRIDSNDVSSIDSPNVYFNIQHNYYGVYINQ
ncbi:hypothetical protein P9112_013760 [Eukaryota sp. TZLM1-RC]